MPYGELTQRRVTQGPQRRVPSADRDSGQIVTRAADAGSLYGDTVQPSPTMGQVDAIGGDLISLITVLPEHIVTSSLSAISGDLGTITAGLITGATIQTGYADPKVVMDPSGIWATNSGGSTTFRVDSATGNVTAVGGTFTGSSFVGGTFTGVTFTGGTFQTGPTNPRVWFDTTGIHATNGAGTELFKVDAATGLLTATNANFTGGTITGGTFIGAVFETSASSPKVRIDATGIRMTAATGMTTFFANAATGQLTLGDPSGSQIIFDPALAANQRLYLNGVLVGLGTIVGPSFKTASTNPGLVMDAFGLNAYNAIGTNTFKLDGTTGTVTATGGTFTGATFQTAAANPRVALDATGLNAYDGGGVNTFSLASSGALSVVGGTITGSLIQTASSGARIELRSDSNQLKAYNSAGVEAIRLQASSGIKIYRGAGAGYGYSIEDMGDGTGLGTLLLMQADADGDSWLYARKYLSLAANMGAATAGSLTLPDVTTGAVSLNYGTGKYVLLQNSYGLDLRAGTDGFMHLAEAAAQDHWITLQASGALSVETTSAGTNPIRLINGCVVLPTNASLCTSLAAFSATVGLRFTAAGAGNTYGYQQHYRQGVRSTANGAIVTPSGAALSGSPIANTNATSPGIDTIRGESCGFIVNATAAGNGRYTNTAVFS